MILQALRYIPSRNVKIPENIRRVLFDSNDIVCLTYTQIDTDDGEFDIVTNLFLRNGPGMVLEEKFESVTTALAVAVEPVVPAWLAETAGAGTWNDPLRITVFRGKSLDDLRLRHAPDSSAGRRGS